MIVYPEIEQGTDEWRSIRAGRATASNFDRIMTPAKMKYSEKASEYMCDLIAECFETDVDHVPTFDNFWTRRGRELEPLARLEMERITGMKITQVGFCLHENGVLGFSPDGLMKGGDSYITGGEFKAPEPSTHVSYINGGVIPREYLAQVHGSMIIGGFKEYHFLSFCPGMQSFYLKVTPNEYTEKLAECLDRFVNEYRELHAKLVPKLQLSLTQQTTET